MNINQIIKTVLILSLILTPLDLFAARKPGTKVTRVRGVVQFRADDNQPWKRAKRHQRIPVGAQIKTGKNSSARLRTKERDNVRLSPRTHIVLEEKTKKKTRFQVLFGKIRATIRRLKKKRRFMVSTPIAVASVRGTEFDTTVDEKDGKSIFDVLEGIVDVSALSGIGKEISLFKNQSSTVLPGEAPSPPRTIQRDIRGDMRERQGINQAREQARFEARREIGLRKFKEFLQADVAHEQRIAEYQDGKTVIDAFGMRVRIEEYIARPAANQFSFVTINTRENNVNFSRYDAFAVSALPSKISEVSRLFSRTGTAGSKPSNYITRQKWFISNGNDLYREWSEGGDMVFFNDLGQSLWQVVFTHWFVELKGESMANFRLVSHWTPHADFLSGADSSTTTESLLTDGALDIPDGYVEFESGTDVGALIGDTRPIDAVAFADRLPNSAIFGNGTYQASEGYSRKSFAKFDDVNFADITGAAARLDAILTAKKTSAVHFYADPAETDCRIADCTTVTKLRVDEYSVNDQGQILSLKDRQSLGGSIDSVNFEQVVNSDDYSNKLDLILSPRIFRDAGLIN